MTNIIDSLNWRYACKLFDNTKKVSKEDLEEIIEAFRLSTSAFGIQPWKLIVIENQEVKDSLVEYSWNQPQINTCSHLLVLCRLTEIDDKLVDRYIEKMSEVRETSKEELSGYEQRVKSYINDLSEDGKEYFSTKQVFIALGNLIPVLAMKKIDSCAMTGIINSEYDRILNLKEKGLSSVAVLPIGYRSEDDKYAKLKKVRFDREEVVEIIS
ncbi:MAG: NAD(P)H-dependent oxidoreductase [Candidatus Gracilibacteria bacterium]|nr:NAD(P)H-dependent oxidoreductase [Candidatus Gracilibacteria bacterium]